MKKLLVILFLAAAAVGITYAWKPRQSIAPGNSLYPVNEQIQDQPIVFSDYVRYPGKGGENALELLQAITTVESKQYDFGVFVESINGVKPDEKHFWKLFYNGEEAQVGARDLQTKTGDVIEWKLEAIQENY